MQEPETILVPKKARIMTSEATLPKRIIANRSEFWLLLNDLLARCLTDCGMRVKSRLEKMTIRSSCEVASSGMERTSNENDYSSSHEAS
jgi:hypothetical protein